MKEAAIRALLAATGRRPAVDAERTERVRRAVHAQWNAELRRRTLRRWTVLRVSLAAAAAAVIVVAIGIGIRSRPVPPDAGPVLRVERVTGAASWRSNGRYRSRPDTPLIAGSVVRAGSSVTTGTNGRVALRAPSGHSVRLDTGTTLRFLSDRSFALDRGGIYVDAQADRFPEIGSITIETPVGTIEDVGTQFEARFDAGILAVRVREGSVTVRAPGARETVRAWESLTLDAAGRIERTSGAGASFPWAEAIVPALSIEGQPLPAFLEWVARERGVSLRFSDPALARRAPSIVLRGSIDGMSLEEATQSVLATCGLSPLWERSTLVVVSP